MLMPQQLIIRIGTSIIKVMITGTSSQGLVVSRGAREVSFDDKLVIPQQSKCFWGVYWNHPVCLCVPVSACVSVCVQNTSFCQSTCGSIKSHLVTGLVMPVLEREGMEGNAI